MSLLVRKSRTGWLQVIRDGTLSVQVVLEKQSHCDDRSEQGTDQERGELSEKRIWDQKGNLWFWQQ